MKKNLHFLIACTILFIGLDAKSQTRYLDDIFSTVDVTSDVVYANNISILPVLQGLPPAATDLTCDIYHPSGDTVTDRPVIIPVSYTHLTLPTICSV